MNIKEKVIEPVKKVCICGGGHQGLAMSAHLALCGIEVYLWNRTYANIEEIAKSKEISCDGVVNGIAHIEKVSSNIEDVFCDFIMVTVPSNAHRDVAKIIAPYVNKNTIIVLNPGRTFGAIDFAMCLRENGVRELPYIAEAQTIIYTCRRKSKNQSTIFAIKHNVKIASIQSGSIDYILKKMPSCISKYFDPVKSVIETSLSNVGMVLHCAPMLMNIGWIESEKVDFKYYYDGISKTVANFIEELDYERIKIAKELGYSIETTKEWMERTYGIKGNNLYDTIRNNIAYSQIDAPGSLNSRYLFEDVPNGLVPVETVGRELGIETSHISLIIDLANVIMKIDYRALGRKYTMKCIDECLKTSAKES